MELAATLVEIRPALKALFVARWMVYPVSLLAISAQLKFICPALTAIAVREVGVVGTAGADAFKYWATAVTCPEVRLLPVL